MEPTRVPTVDELRAAPKVLLHDHLDGGLRPATIVELAAEAGHELPTNDADALGLVRRGGRLGLPGALPRDVRAHRRRDAERRGAHPGRARVRRGPRRGRRGLRRDPLRPRAPRPAGPDPRPGGRRGAGGLRPGRRGQRRADRRTPAGDGDASGPPSLEIAELAIRYRDQGVAGSTSPARRRATRRPASSTRSTTSARRTATPPATPARPSGCRRSGRRSSGAAPTGSATASASSTTSPSPKTVRSKLGRLAAYVRDKRIPLEMCPSSNLQTGAADSIAEHPIGLLADLRFRVTVNTDNRLMSGTSMTREHGCCARRSAGDCARTSG